MGEGAGVDIAQDSHMTGVFMFGGMQPDEKLFCRKLFPTLPAGYAQGILIDDHLGCQLGPRGGLPSWGAAD